MIPDCWSVVSEFENWHIDEGKVFVYTYLYSILFKDHRMPRI